MALLGTFETHPWMAGCAALGVIFAAYYMLPMVQRIFFNRLDKDENRVVPDLTRRELAILVPMIALMIWMPYQIASAGMIGTDQVVASTSQADRTAVMSFLNRSDVATKLQSLGIDPSSAKDRVAAMTDQEVQSLAGRINALPAGGDVSTAGVILILILIGAAVWWFWQR